VRRRTELPAVKKSKRSLRSARLADDSVLEECFADRHRMLSGEQGLPVMRIQQALIDLRRSVDPLGADGILGFDTGTAVSAEFPCAAYASASRRRRRAAVRVADDAARN
jgi:hypothetical protein